jgi:GNAT superfamily N-acetyltransferase
VASSDPPCPLDKVLYFCGMATVPAFRGRGLAVRLHMDCIAAAERSGFRYAVADVWTAASKSVVDKLGMKPYKGIRNAFRNVTLDDGTQPLAHRADVPEFIILAGKSLPWATE